MPQYTIYQADVTQMHQSLKKAFSDVYKKCVFPTSSPFSLTRAALLPPRTSTSLSLLRREGAPGSTLRSIRRSPSMAGMLIGMLGWTGGTWGSVEGGGREVRGRGRSSLGVGSSEMGSAFSCGWTRYWKLSGRTEELTLVVDCRNAGNASSKAHRSSPSSRLDQPPRASPRRLHAQGRAEL